MKDAEKSILRKPLVGMINRQGNDANSHSEFETACGFVPDGKFDVISEIGCGRTMFSITALIWRKYSGAVIDFFKRDKSTKPVSVEIDVFNTK